jgi:putative hydrolase of the HAD superfamily
MSMFSRPMSRSTLLLDADDTLWENNIYFLEATERFLEEVEQFRIERTEAARLLTETERKHIPSYGYGSRTFTLSLIEAYRAIAGEQATEEAVGRLEGAARAIMDREHVDILPGVAVALEHPSQRHRLILVTKGQSDEQMRKLDRSGLARHFEAVEVVSEKDESTYRALIAKYDLVPEQTWMIGNSPKSDINPALAAGLNAVLVPHPMTWDLEIEEVDHTSDRLAVVDSFGRVIEIFAVPEDRTE